MTDSAQPSPTAAPAKPAESWWDTLRFLLYLFIGALILRSFVIAPFSIPSGSMLPNLMIGDYLFIAKWPYGYSRYSMPFGIGGFSGRVPAGLPALGDMAGGPPLGRVDDLAGEQGVAARGKAGLFGEREERLDAGAAQMGLGEIEADAALLDRKARQPVGLGREQFSERRRGRLLHLIQSVADHGRPIRAAGGESLAA